MIQDIAYKLYLKDCDSVSKHTLSKQQFLFDSCLYVNEYYYKAKYKIRKEKLKNILCGLQN
jgi:hypothetical protein